MICVDVKLLLYAINGIMVVLGVLLVAVGIKCSRIPGPTVSGNPASIVLGTFIAIIAVFAFIALCLRQIWLNILYIILLVCIFGGLVVIGVMNLLMDHKMVIKSFLKSSYLLRSKDQIDGNILEFQTYFECCGYSGPDSREMFLHDPIYLSEGDKSQVLTNATYLIPECCPLQPMACVKLAAFKGKCFETMLKEHTEWANIIGSLMLISSLILIAAGVFSVKELTHLY